MSTKVFHIYRQPRCRNILFYNQLSGVNPHYGVDSDAQGEAKTPRCSVVAYFVTYNKDGKAESGPGGGTRKFSRRAITFHRRFVARKGYWDERL